MRRVALCLLCLYVFSGPGCRSNKSAENPVPTVPVATPPARTSASELQQRKLPPMPEPAIVAAAYSGMYVLQELINFDSLEGAQFDPASKTLVLFGSHAHRDRLAAVPYFDYLAAALESHSPTFSLVQTEVSRQQLMMAKQNPDALDIFDRQKRLNVFGAWLFQQAGINVPAGTDFDALGEKVGAAGGITKVFSRMQPPLQVPPEVSRHSFPQEMKMMPVIKGMPPSSLLADVALEADYRSKYLEEMPELKQTLISYQTYSEWERIHGTVDSPNTHMWVSAGRIEVRESLDGQVMRFEQFPMKFNMEKYIIPNPRGPEPSVPDSILSGYAEMLTGNYDKLAEQFPVFYQLREAMKVLLVADWLRRGGWSIELPRQGRIQIQQPAEIPGLMSMEVTVTPSNSGIRIRSTTWWTGGIDLRVENFRNAVKDSTMDHLEPFEHMNEQSQKIEDAPGWAGQAKARGQTKDYIALKPSEALATQAQGAKENYQGRISAGCVFDGVACEKASGTVFAGWNRSTHQISPDVAAKLEKNSEYQRLKKTKEEADARYKDLEGQLQQVWQQEQQSGANKGELQVKEANVKQQISEAKSEEQTVDIQLQDFEVKFEEESEPTDKTKMTQEPAAPKTQ